MREIKLKKAALALLKIGVNLQKGQVLVLQASTEALDLAREVTKQAFEMGAKDVVLHLEDAQIERLRAIHCDEETLKEVPDYKKEGLEYYFRQGNAVQMGLNVTYPSLNLDVKTSKLLAQNFAKNEVRNVVRKYIHKGELKWVGTARPGENWATTLYPELSKEEAFLKLDNQIFEMLRVDEETDVLENWENHIEKLAVIAKKLNDYNFKSLHITTELGTNIKMDLVKNHIWNSAGSQPSEKLKERYVANMPTEEVFTDPDYRTVSGIVFSSMPLMVSGKLVNDFSITFDDGKAISCSASKNIDLLEDAIFKNMQTRFLGEVALVSKESPIKKLNQVFCNGLIDENAACHFALGSSFPSCIKGGDSMSKEELLNAGVNVANAHTDFMWGTDKTKVVGITFDKKEITIMENGDFVI